MFFRASIDRSCDIQTRSLLGFIKKVSCHCAHLLSCAEMKINFYITTQPSLSKQNSQSFSLYLYVAKATSSICCYPTRKDFFCSLTLRKDEKTCPAKRILVKFQELGSHLTLARCLFKQAIDFFCWLCHLLPHITQKAKRQYTSFTLLYDHTKLAILSI